MVTSLWRVINALSCLLCHVSIFGCVCVCVCVCVFDRRQFSEFFFVGLLCLLSVNQGPQEELPASVAIQCALETFCELLPTWQDEDANFSRRLRSLFEQLLVYFFTTPREKTTHQRISSLADVQWLLEEMAADFPSLRNACDHGNARLPVSQLARRVDFTAARPSVGVCADVLTDLLHCDGCFHSGRVRESPGEAGSTSSTQVRTVKWQWLVDF